MSSTTIDDTDPSISFDNGWWPTQNADAFMGSLMHTDTNGARATVSFEGLKFVFLDFPKLKPYRNIN